MPLPSPLRLRTLQNIRRSRFSGEAAAVPNSGDVGCVYPVWVIALARRFARIAGRDLVCGTQNPTRASKRQFVGRGNKMRATRRIGRSATRWLVVLSLTACGGGGG